MRTNSPPDCWQAIQETEREERDKESDRQRGACKERNEKTKAECKEWWNNHISNSKPILLLCFIWKFSTTKNRVTCGCWIHRRDGSIPKIHYKTSTTNPSFDWIFFSQFTSIISLNFLSFSMVPLASALIGGASEEKRSSRRNGLNLLAKNWPCYPLHHRSVHFYFSRNRGVAC